MPLEPHEIRISEEVIEIVGFTPQSSLISRLPIADNGYLPSLSQYVTKSYANMSWRKGGEEVVLILCGHLYLFLLNGFPRGQGGEPWVQDKSPETFHLAFCQLTLFSVQLFS